MNTGDLVFAAFCSSSIAIIMNSIGYNLQVVYDETKKYHGFLKEIKNEYTANPIIILQQMVPALKGFTNNNTSFSDGDFDEEQFEKQLWDSKVDSVTALYYVIKLQLSYLFEDYLQATKEILKSEQVMPRAMGVLYSADYCFYHSLALAALYPTSPPGDKKRYWTRIKKNQKKMKKWADNCAENFLHKYLLVAAEMARIRRQDRKAATFYSQGIKSALENGYTQIAAIGHELAAKYYMSGGHFFTAKAHLVEAKNAYLSWGAIAKVKHLNEKYPFLHTEKPVAFKNGEPLSGEIAASGFMTTTSDVTGETAGSFHKLDLMAIMKASQAISGEIALEPLLKKLMTLVLENAGAQKGFLVLHRNGSLRVEAEGSAGQENRLVLQSIPLENSDRLSPSVVRYVVRTKKTVILHDAAHDGIFVFDGYIMQNKPLSILCTPIIHQGKLTGALYLENNLVKGAFTPDRVGYNLFR